MLRVLVAVVVVALSGVEASAQWYDTKTGAALPDTEWRKTAGELGAMLVLTDNPKAFLEEWSRTPEASAPRVQTASQVKRGGILAALVFFSGCGVEGGVCAAVVDFKVLRPDSTVYGEHAGSRAWTRPAARKGLVLLSEAHLQIRIEPADPFGVYPVLAVLREPGTGRVVRLKQEFRVIP